MTQEEKSLLLKDLCARLPYHVHLKVWLKDGTTEEGVLDLEHNYGDVLRDAFYYNEIVDIKPYFRPMSSMTEEEKEEYINIKQGECNGCVLTGKGDPNTEFLLVDFFNSHYFDYRGLIPMGLALEASKDMYN